jgi:PadR family transcriptional regulator, regulatory protein PadR
MNSSTRTEQVFLILTALVDRPRHGYGIVQEVARLSDGQMQLKVGTLYGALDRLTGEGLLALDHDEVEAGRLRRYYRLTDHGASVLAADAQRLAANAQLAARRLRERGIALPGAGGALGTAGGTA